MNCDHDILYQESQPLFRCYFNSKSPLFYKIKFIFLQIHTLFGIFVYRPNKLSSRFFNG